MRDISKPYMENAMLQTNRPAVYTIDLTPGDMIRISDRGRDVLDGIVIVSEIALVEDPCLDGDQLFVVKVRKMSSNDDMAEARAPISENATE